MSFQPQSATILEGRYAWAQYAPHASLRPWVSSYWVLRTAGRHVVRTLPDACTDLTLHLLPEPRAYLAAAQATARSWPCEHPVNLLGARLLPGTAAMLGVAIDRLGDGWTPLETLLPGKVVGGLVRAVTSAPAVLDRITALDAFFSERLLNREIDPRLTGALREVFARRGDLSMAELARRSGAHPRTLARLFDRWVGLSPKRFARIVRLQAALRALPDRGSWAGVAFELGYCDQAHFLREVRELFGSTPREIMRLSDRTR
jgi:AraC-like DNA-binding protein